LFYLDQHRKPRSV